MRQEETKKVESMANPPSSSGKESVKAKEVEEEEEEEEDDDDSDIPGLIPANEVSLAADEEKKKEGKRGGVETKREGGGGGRGGGGGGGGGSGKSATVEKKAVEKKTEAKAEASGGVDRKERTKAFNYTSDVYNGADMDQYKWSQTVTELEIKVALEEGTTAKQVKVDIQSEHLRVELLHPQHKVYISVSSRNFMKGGQTRVLEM